jgi:hypothetical protein
MSTGAIAERDVRTVAAPLADGRVKMPPRGCPNLSQALAVARDRCRTAFKGGFNDFHKYKYASADEVITVAKDALAETGLAIIPQSQKLSILGDGNATVHVLDRTIFLSHSSGEFVPIEIGGWPVIPDKGRPLDKAVAVALTCSLAYWLRDLLQMPRGDEADMNTRDDRAHEPGKKPAPVKADDPHDDPQPENGGPSAAMLRTELEHKVKELARLRGRTADEVHKGLRDAAKSKNPNHPDRLEDVHPNGLRWLIKKADGWLDELKAKAAEPKPADPPRERQPGEDDPEPDDADGEQDAHEHGGEAGGATLPQQPPADAARRVLADQTIAILHQCGTDWNTAIAESLGIIGRRLLRGAHAAECSQEEHVCIRAWAKKRKAERDKARQGQGARPEGASPMGTPTSSVSSAGPTAWTGATVRRFSPATGRGIRRTDRE